MNLKQEILKMDTKSEEFNELFHFVNDKYFTFENPDDYQEAARILDMILRRGEEWSVFLLVKLYHELLSVVEFGRPAAHGTAHVKGKELFFDFYIDKKQIAKMHTMLKEAVLATAAGKGLPS